MGSYSSAVTSCPVGIPRVSILGPLLFSVYTSPLSTIAQSDRVFQQQHTDDTQLYIALSQFNYCDELTTLQSCLSLLDVWFCENGMAFNPAKSDAILFGTSQRLKNMSVLTSVKIADSVIQFSDSIKILGVTLYSNFNMGPIQRQHPSFVFAIYVPLENLLICGSFYGRFRCFRFGVVTV